MASLPARPIEARKLSFRLGLGILLLPYLFAWFTLRPGYSRQARVVALGWMTALVLVIAHANRNDNAQTSSAPSSTPAVDPVDPMRAVKDQSATVARELVPRAMKDPSSAKFGNVWGVTTGVACGYVNGKNSFGAMTGQQGFIMAGGSVEFEGAPGFVRHWNTLCVKKLLSKPPQGVLDMRWGSRPGGNLKPTSEPTDGLQLFAPNGSAPILEGVQSNDAAFAFDHGKLYGANYYFDGEAARDAVRAALIKKFGPPLTYDEDANSYNWEWPKQQISIDMTFSDSAKRTTVNYTHGPH